jgi:hypothetical protein
MRLLALANDLNILQCIHDQLVKIMDLSVSVRSSIPQQNLGIVNLIIQLHLCRKKLANVAFALSRKSSLKASTASLSWHLSGLKLDEPSMLLRTEHLDLGEIIFEFHSGNLLILPQV